MHYTIRIFEPCPELGLHPGDLVTFEPEIGSPEYPLYFHRPLPANAETLLPMLESGAAELLTPDSTVFNFRGGRWLDSAAAGAGARPESGSGDSRRSDQPGRGARGAERARSKRPQGARRLVPHRPEQPGGLRSTPPLGEEDPAKAARG